MGYQKDIASNISKAAKQILKLTMPGGKGLIPRRGRPPKENKNQNAEILELSIYIMDQAELLQIGKRPYKKSDKKTP